MLDTGATLSIVVRRLLKTFKRTKTVAIRIGDGRTFHSLGGVDVTICLGHKTVTQHCTVLDTGAFDTVIGTDFLRRNPGKNVVSPTPLFSALRLWQWALLRTFGAVRTKKSLGYAMQTRQTIVLKTTNWPVTFLKMDWQPFR